MKLKKHYITIALLITGSITTNAQLSKWQTGMVKEEFLYEKAPFPSCHAATIAETPSGLVAAFFGGTKERDPDVEIYMSRMTDGKWLAPVSVANGIQNDGKRLPTWNPVLYQVPNGDLLLFYKIGPKPSEWWGMMKSSKDGGKTWSKAIKLPADGIGPVKNKPILLSNGNLFAPSSREGNGWKIHFEVTSDNGKNWRTIGPIENGGLNAIQPSILQHGDGKLQILHDRKIGQSLNPGRWIMEKPGRLWQKPVYQTITLVRMP